MRVVKRIAVFLLAAALVAALPLHASIPRRPFPALSAEHCALNVVRSYDLRSRATNMVERAGAVSRAFSYAYDPLGRRASTKTGAVLAFHAYDGGRCVADLDASGKLLRVYAWGPGTDILHAMTVYPSGVGATNVYYAAADAHGSTWALVSSGGNSLECYDYDAWGCATISGMNYTGRRAASLYGNRFMFHGGAYSAATGLYQFRARWYSPELGRWLSPDPIGLEGGLNLYEFCRNDPVNFRDPSGLIRWSDAGKSFGGAVGNGLGAVGGGVLAVGSGGLGTAVGGVIVFKSAYGFAANARNLYDAVIDKDPVSNGTFLNDVAELALPGNCTVQKLATGADIAIDLLGMRYSRIANGASRYDFYGNEILRGGGKLGGVFEGNADAYLDGPTIISAGDALSR